ncbi:MULTISPECIES: IS256 family transposase [Lactobacillus]|jgi:transposase-like protein|uniref:Mutator family transposase n=7 Tax=Lactobacillus TaxID=1578 RepID=A0AB73BN50_9LACO|nr:MULTISPECIES: IS256 family transposase [Lactobacillus]KAA8781551.1 IS256 family transposase [Lactobacillus crispatus]KAA8791825.1 IS256 family transposase [Lactobacillus crispatus]KAA8791951.1 IS256 family transposase [Lactobacillus crispatus]KAA8796245.1 IS256 family transposase [Lactobacillus crispatus]KAA8796724.1 IS256 family transposase [Lactobacillus crispatus]
MNDFTKDMANALFNQDKINDLFRQKLQQAVNDLLESELTAFLGYNPYERDGWNTGNSRNGAYYRKVDTQFGQIEIKVPRDRNGEFHQHTMPDYKRHTDVLEQTVIKLYSKGVTTREIADLIEKMYGGYYSPAMVSNISKEMIPKVEAYHQRHLSDKFFCVYLDATYIPLKRVTYEREAVYIAIGIKPNGHKEVIDYCIAPTENIEIWSEMLKGFKSRGLEQVELFLSDGVVGMKEAICQSYPKAHFQRCLVHVMRNISAKMRVDDRQKALDEFKQIHTQSNKEMAVQVLHEFYQNWEKAYKNVVRDLRQVEPDLLTFYNYPPAIRASIYSTNMIESFNNRLKRKTKPKTEFPTEQSLDTFIGVQAMDYNDRYFNRIHKGFGQVRDTLESYFD